MKRVIAAVAVLVVMVRVGTADGDYLVTVGTATYGGKNYNLIYEESQHLLWLDYSAGAGGPTDWNTQMAWAAGLNASGVLTYNLNPGVSVSWARAWRLPATVDEPYVWGYDGTTTGGYNITSSEMGHLYYTSLEDLGYYAPDGTFPNPGFIGIDRNKGPFSHITNDLYWSGTEYSTDPRQAWFFYLNWGAQKS